MLSATLRGCLTKIQWYNGPALCLAITIAGRQFQILPFAPSTPPHTHTTANPRPPFSSETKSFLRLLTAKHSSPLCIWRGGKKKEKRKERIRSLQISFRCRLCALILELSFITSSCNAGELRSPLPEKRVMEQPTGFELWYCVSSNLLPPLHTHTHTNVLVSDVSCLASILNRG